VAEALERGPRLSLGQARRSELQCADLREPLRRRRRRDLHPDLVPQPQAQRRLSELKQRRLALRSGAFPRAQDGPARSRGATAISLSRLKYFARTRTQSARTARKRMRAESARDYLRALALSRSTRKNFASWDRKANCCARSSPRQAQSPLRAFSKVHSARAYNKAPPCCSDWPETDERRPDIWWCC
jgi:hypothetical protein